MSFVDPSLEWVNEFKKCLDNGIFDIKKNKKNGMSPLSCTGDGKIHLYLNGDSTDFNILSHEFAHYLSGSNNENYNDNVDNLLREFPSIYYEILATEYLCNVGVSDDELESIKDIRKNYIIYFYKRIADILKFSYRYMSDGYINYQEIVDMYRNTYSSDLSLDFINKHIDTIIVDTISTGTDILRLLCYIMAYYLVSLFDEKDFEDMKNITDNLLDFRFSDIIDIS